MEKYRGNIRVTNEQLAVLLGLPKDVAISCINYDMELEIASILLKGEKESNLTPLSAEGAKPLMVNDEYQILLSKNKNA